jgi:uracil-DNA glycosylase
MIVRASPAIWRRARHESKNSSSAFAPARRAFVKRIRADRGVGAEVPHFDPWDGGIRAQLLFVLEAPGPKTIASGFVSRNNHDESASNFFRANAEAHIPRELTASWNVVPWALRNAHGRAFAPRTTDLQLGISYLAQLVALLPQLRAVVLVGKKAACAIPHLEMTHSDLKCFTSPHPSPQFVNRLPENRTRLTDALRLVAGALDLSR